METEQICMPRRHYKFYTYLMLFIVSAFIIIMYHQSCELKKKKEQFTSFSSTAGMSDKSLKSRIKQLESDLHQSQLNTERCRTALAGATANNTNTNLHNRVLNKVYNPIAPPERIYPGGSFHNREPYYGYQMVGFLNSADGERLALYGRPKYRNRTDKMEYFAVDDTRNKLKIPFEVKGDDALDDGDTVDIDRLGGKEFTANVYEYEGFKYYG